MGYYKSARPKRQAGHTTCRRSMRVDTSMVLATTDSGRRNTARSSASRAHAQRRMADLVGRRAHRAWLEAVGCTSQPSLPHHSPRTGKRHYHHPTAPDAHTQATDTPGPTDRVLARHTLDIPLHAAHSDTAAHAACGGRAQGNVWRRPWRRRRHRLHSRNCVSPVLVAAFLVASCCPGASTASGHGERQEPPPRACGAVTLLTASPAPTGINANGHAGRSPRLALRPAATIGRRRSPLQAVLCWCARRPSTAWRSARRTPHPAGQLHSTHA